jgi:hypothetical protein
VDIIRGRHQAATTTGCRTSSGTGASGRARGAGPGAPYTGTSAHTEHAHFSARYTTAQESDTSPWGLLLEDDDMTTKAEFTAWLKDADVRAALAAAVLNTDGVVRAPGNPAAGTGPDGKPVNTHWAVESYLQQIYGASVAARTGVTALAAKDMVDEPALIAACWPVAARPSWCRR